jgi:hypothetical protein
MAGPLGGAGAVDPGAPIINAKNVDDGPPAPVGVPVPTLGLKGAL